MFGGIFKKEKQLSELEEEDERLGVELSIAQKNKAIAELKQRGLTPQHFGNNWSRILQWLKTH
jgi:hypothetical protein